MFLRLHLDMCFVSERKAKSLVLIIKFEVLWNFERTIIASVMSVLSDLIWFL